MIYPTGEIPGDVRHNETESLLHLRALGWNQVAAARMEPILINRYFEIVECSP